jgi:hypothetical protein
MKQTADIGEGTQGNLLVAANSAVTEPFFKLFEFMFSPEAVRGHSRRLRGGPV